MPLLNPQCFNQPGATYFIPNVGSEHVDKQLCYLIGLKEPEFFHAALGKAFWDIVAATIDDNSGAGPITVAEARFERLLNGVPEMGFDGLKACAARYVYYYYRRRNNSTTSDSGTEYVSAVSEGNQVISPYQRMIDAWNENWEQVQKMWDFIYSEIDTNGAYVYSEWRTVFPYGVDCRTSASRLHPINSFNL